MNEQEEFWLGEFGSEYIARNDSSTLLASNVSLFADIFRRTAAPDSVLELGANIGLNLSALGSLFPKQNRSGLEINPIAYEKLKANPAVDSAYLGSVVRAPIESQFELVFTKGVLIHLAPESLAAVYQRINAWSKRYVLFIEYYSPFPVTIPYRGHTEKLFKRDFPGEFLQAYPEFLLRDYGFVYHGDRNHPQDDLNWFLMERSR